MRRYCLIFLFFLVIGAVTIGCGTVYKVAVDERSVGTQAADEKITMAIRKKFVDDDMVKTLDVSTYCYSGHVYLVGEYETLTQKNRILKRVSEIEGVTSVTEHFLPKKKADSCGTADNLKLVAGVKAQLIKDKGIRSTNIEVKALQCNIILLGLVGSQGEISKAVAHAKGVEGVRGVTSYLRVMK
jgi:hyperosmotically inducible protein